ncbi:hypothetical protein [Ornithinibacillus halotolerans]|uniref:Uncharacterized protein n=1 Tax=Ornithinibacillus halotolerans TaxID=1274357 RepID=A0A916WDL8_9BACI|nr:hypothetical protein [Ornithinibacillus halotolerans]GGA89202.1 hypothetical protein GCM10008025_34780 [Ornithinibacillus halotolerans]
MNNQIKGLLYFYVNDFRHSFLIFWSILLLVLVVSISFSIFLLGYEDGMMAFGFPFGIYFYCAFLGFLAVKESIPFAIKIGATRKNIFISIGLFFILLAIFKALVANIIQELVLLIVDNANITSFLFIHPAMMFDDTWFNRVIIDICMMFFLLAAMFVFGLLFYKFGIAGGGAVTGVLGVALLLGMAKGWIFDFISNLVKQIDIVFFYQVLGIGFLFFLISFIFLRRITIEKKR